MVNKLTMTNEEDFEIPETGAVFTFGRSRFADNQSSHFFIRNDPVIEISCGDEHTALICENGRVFVFGHNDYGQLGLGHTKTVTKPSCLKYMKPFKSQHVACGKGHTVISTECGKLFSFGSNSDGQLGLNDTSDRLVPCLVNTEFLNNDTIKILSAGCLHSGLLTENGDIYLWGSNSDGQCGLNEETHVLVPTKLSTENPVRYLSCGYYHTGFVNINGEAFFCGEGDSGKLGIAPPHSNYNSPQKLDINEEVKLVECGGNHTVIVTHTDMIYAFGSNFSGQLGIGVKESECSSPTLVNLPNDVNITSISCGESHSAFLTETGRLYTCGDARHGKLCNEDDSVNQVTPTLINTFENHFCILVSCGGCHSMVVAKPRQEDNDIAVVCSKPKLQSLPPLKLRKDSIEIEKPDTENSKEEVQEDEDDTKQTQEDIKEDNADANSNTESILNSEETQSQTEEIYSDIIQPPQVEEQETERIEEVHVENNGYDIENDVIIKKGNPFTKLFNVFKRKKSATAVLLDKPENLRDKSDVSNEIRRDSTASNGKPGNQHMSRACVLI